MPYVKIIEDESAKYGTKMNEGDLNFQTLSAQLLGEHVAGNCNGTMDGQMMISVLDTYWRDAVPDAKELLALHELGHCLLGRLHRDGYDYVNKRFYSLMTDAIGSYEFRKNRTYYLEELVTYVPSAQHIDVTPGSE